MQTITIHGRRTLHGSIRPAAAKNSTLPLLAAATPRAVWLEADTAALAEAGILRGGDVMKHLENCPQAVLLAVTLGHSGSGIDDELAQRLFQPFSAGNTRSGSGLGLAICQEIVQTLGGQIELRNLHDELGLVRGLQALIQLPLHNGDAQDMDTALT